MPATFISDDEDNEPTYPPSEGPITITPSDAPADKPPRSESEGVTTDFTVNPMVIPSDDQDGPLLKSDQAALMLLHEQLGHCSFAHLKQMAEQGMSLLLNAQAAFMGRITASPGEHIKSTQKSNRQPYQELWSALTNLNPPFRASCPLQKGNRRSEGIEARRCLWIMPRISRTSTCTNTSQRTKQSTQNMRLSALPNSTEYGFSITIAIMEDSPTKHLWTMFGRRTKQSLSVASVRTTKMASLNGYSGYHRERPNLSPPRSTPLAQGHSCQSMAPSNQARR